MTLIIELLEIESKEQFANIRKRKKKPTANTFLHCFLHPFSPLLCDITEDFFQKNLIMYIKEIHLSKNLIFFINYLCDRKTNKFRGTLTDSEHRSFDIVTH
jgi:hypothetical protein